MADEKKMSWRDPVVLAAIVTSLGGLVVTVVQVRGTNNDIRDSYKVTSEAINKLNLQMGQLDGKIDAHIAWHQTKAQAIKAAVTEPIEKAESHKKPAVITLGSIDVQGHVGAGTGAKMASKPAVEKPSTEIFTEYRSDSGADNMVAVQVDNSKMLNALLAAPPVPAPAAPAAVLSTDLDTALKSERGK